MRKIFILLFLLLPAITSAAKKPECLTFRAEWGVGLSLFELHNFVYADQYGSTVYDRGTSLTFLPKASALLSIGINLGWKSNISLGAGIRGAGADRYTIPVEILYIYSFKGLKSNGFILSADGGITFPVYTSANKNGLIAGIGGGYRFIMNSKLNMDIKLKLDACLDHPGIYNSMRRNNALYSGLNTSIALEF